MKQLTEGVVAIAARHQARTLRVDRPAVAQSLLLPELGFPTYPPPAGHDMLFVQAHIPGNRQTLREQLASHTG